MKRYIALFTLLLWSSQSFAQSASDPFASIPILKKPAIAFSDYPKYADLKEDELQALSKAGDVTAQMMLSEKLRKGPNAATRQAGADLLLMIAQKGYSDAQHDLASQYWFGDILKRDQALAILWYRQALRGDNTSTAGVWAHQYDNRSAMLKEDGTLLQPDVALPPDMMKSLMWNLVSFKMGYPASSYKVIVPPYRKHLSEQEFTKAVAMADACFNSAFENCGWPKR